MEEEMLKEIGKGLNVREKIFAKTFIKVFHMGRIETFNNLKPIKLVSPGNKITFF